MVVALFIKPSSALQDAWSRCESIEIELLVSVCGFSTVLCQEFFHLWENLVKALPVHERVVSNESNDFLIGLNSHLMALIAEVLSAS